MRSCKRSACRLKFVHLEFLGPETEGKGWSDGQDSDCQVARSSVRAKATAHPTPQFPPHALDLPGRVTRGSFGAGRPQTRQVGRTSSGHAAARRLACAHDDADLCASCIMRASVLF